jgi:hypothetical protein
MMMMMMMMSMKTMMNNDDDYDDDEPWSLDATFQQRLMSHGRWMQHFSRDWIIVGLDDAIVEIVENFIFNLVLSHGRWLQ